MKSAETIAKALGGRKSGASWMASCPVHDDREPSLSIRDADDGKLLVRCHAGCSQQNVTEALRARGLWRSGANPRQDVQKSPVLGPAHPGRDSWGPLPPDSDARNAAVTYCDRGWSPVPLHRAEKRPHEKGWPTLRLTAREAEQKIAPGGNVGIILGNASSGLVDIDLDAPEAVELADRFLPPTDSVFGRPSKPRSHRLYRVKPVPETTKFQDPAAGSMLVEVRADGGVQTVFPPSLHPGGERVAWERDGQPAQLSADKLLQAVALLAAAAAVVRYAGDGAVVLDRPPEEWLDALKGAPDGVRETARKWLRMTDAYGENARDYKPRLPMDDCNPDRTVAALRDILSHAGRLYNRGVPVRVAFDEVQRGAVAQVVTPDGLVLLAHEVCRPYVVKVRDGAPTEVDARLKRNFAVMYLDWRGEWNLPVLNGIASAPLLRDNGDICSAKGYDAGSGMWIESMPDLTGRVPERPTMDEAAAALGLVRDVFKTFCFADAETLENVASGVASVDTVKLPGKDESAFLSALLTAVCRPSLHLAPGVLLRAAPMSGAGAGKGLLARCMCIIAFGREPHAVTGGATAEELEKRIAAELIEGSPALFLDNLNNTALKSDLLASAITERPARVRLLGRSQMVPLNASALVVLTGNGLTVSEDLARRFIAVDFDPRTEAPEARRFTNDIRAEVTMRRTELLVALLTIWRWGRQATNIKPGRPLGSFEQWGRWVRDPLLALGCQDPAERVSEAKERDGRRQAIVDLFTIWWQRHRDQPIAARDLHEDVRQTADPQGRGRQFVVAQLERLAGTRMAGFALTRQQPVGRWGAATFALTETAGEDSHRGHRGDGTEDPSVDRSDVPHTDARCGKNKHGANAAKTPMPPMPPMSSAITPQPVPDEPSSPGWSARL